MLEGLTPAAKVPISGLSKNIIEVFASIAQNGATALFVGGYVREALLTRTLPQGQDVDIAVNLPVEQVAQILRRMGAKVITKHFTNITVYREEVMEITSTRHDIKCDGRGAQMQFSPSFYEDSIRRDFTINALYMSHTGDIYDFNNGVEDLRTKSVRFIGHPTQRIKEDYLRILRFFRFSLKYAASMCKEGLSACIEMKEGTANLSAERITAELLKMLSYTQTAQTEIDIFTQMARHCILPFGLYPQILSLLKQEPPFIRLVGLTAAKRPPHLRYAKAQVKLIQKLENAATQIKHNTPPAALYYHYNQEELTHILKLVLAIGAQRLQAMQSLRDTTAAWKAQLQPACQAQPDITPTVQKIQNLHQLAHHAHFTLEKALRATEDTLHKLQQGQGYPQLPISKKELFCQFGPNNITEKYNAIILAFVKSNFQLSKQALLVEASRL